MRRIAADSLLVAAAVLLIATALGGYAWRVLFDSDEFSARATVALQDPSVRELIAERVTDELVRRQPDALAVRPAVVSAVSGVVGGAAFASLFRSGVRDVHGAVFRRNQNTVTLTVADVGLVAAEALRLLQPQLASELEAREPATLVDYDVGGLTGDLARAARDTRVLVVVLALLTIAAAAGGVTLSSDRRRAAANLGIAIAVAGVVIVVAQLVARTIVLDRFSAGEQRPRRRRCGTPTSVTCGRPDG